MGQKAAQQLVLGYRNLQLHSITTNGAANSTDIAAAVSTIGLWSGHFCLRLLLRCQRLWRQQKVCCSELCSLQKRGHGNGGEGGRCGRMGQGAYQYLGDGRPGGLSEAHDDVGDALKKIETV